MFNVKYYQTKINYITLQHSVGNSTLLYGNKTSPHKPIESNIKLFNIYQWIRITQSSQKLESKFQFFSPHKITQYLVIII